jgi:hypothetical protein
MKNKLLVILFLCFSTISVFAQDLNSDYKVIQVNKKVRDIAVENPYASPLDNYMAIVHSWIDGKYDTFYSEMIDAVVRKQSHKPYSIKDAELMLNSEIEQVVIYRDSIGLVFRKETLIPIITLLGAHYGKMENGCISAKLFVLKKTETIEINGLKIS